MTNPDIDVLSFVNLFLLIRRRESNTGVEFNVLETHKSVFIQANTKFLRLGFTTGFPRSFGLTRDSKIGDLQKQLEAAAISCTEGPQVIQCLRLLEARVKQK